MAHVSVVNHDVFVSPRISMLLLADSGWTKAAFVALGWQLDYNRLVWYMLIVAADPEAGNARKLL